MGNSDRLKRAVIKEELVALTGDFVKAVILQQFLFWSQRVEDFDKFILEERQRARDTGEPVVIDLTQGWIYKKADELSEETMLGLSKSNMMNHIKKLVENGWLDQRRNPKNRMDKTYQYRVNISRIQKGLLNMGYSLEGYRVPLDFIVEFEPRSFETELRSSDSKLRSSKTLPSNHESEPHSSDSKLGGSNSFTRRSDTEQQYQRSQSEITSEITNTQNKTMTLTASPEKTDIDVCDELQRRIGYQVNPTTLRTWRSYANDDTILHIATTAAKDTSIRNVVGYISSVLKNGYTEPSNQSETTNPDPRYAEFYKLFPDT